MRKIETVLASLREHVEGSELEGWGDVYLDNARPAGMSARQFAGYLAALEKRGDYRVVDGYAWGSVRLTPREIEPNRRREADRIDGYDRDDLGESPDY